MFVSLARYRRHAIFTRERGRRARIALVHASGPVVSGEAPATGELSAVSRPPRKSIARRATNASARSCFG